jgi:hypothetical protein
VASEAAGWRVGHAFDFELGAAPFGFKMQSLTLSDPSLIGSCQSALIRR